MGVTGSYGIADFRHRDRRHCVGFAAFFQTVGPSGPQGDDNRVFCFLPERPGGILIIFFAA